MKRGDVVILSELGRSKLPTDHRARDPYMKGIIQRVGKHRGLEQKPFYVVRFGTIVPYKYEPEVLELCNTISTT